mgnify:CR=1 FL=1
MANRWKALLAGWCLLSVGGCGLYGQGGPVSPDAENPSAIAYAQKMMKDLSTGLDKLISPALSKVKDEGEYRVFTGSAYAPTDRTVLENFARLCQTLQGDMVGKACRRGTGDDVKFLVHTTSGPIPGGHTTAWQQVTVNLKVYEPVGGPSPKFLHAISEYGYQTVAERDAEERARQVEQRAGQAEKRAARLAAQLRALGIEPES